MFSVSNVRSTATHNLVSPGNCCFKSAINEALRYGVSIKICVSFLDKSDNTCLSFFFFSWLSCGRYPWNRKDWPLKHWMLEAYMTWNKWGELRRNQTHIPQAKCFMGFHGSCHWLDRYLNESHLKQSWSSWSSWSYERRWDYVGPLVLSWWGDESLSSWEAVIISSTHQLIISTISPACVL